MTNIVFCELKNLFADCLPFLIKQLPTYLIWPNYIAQIILKRKVNTDCKLLNKYALFSVIKKCIDM